MKIKLQSKSYKGILLSLILVISISLYGCGEKISDPDIKDNIDITVDDLNYSTNDENQSEEEVELESESKDSIDSSDDEITNSSDDKKTTKLKKELEKVLKSLDNIEEFYYEATMSSGPLNFSSKTWMKDGKMRSEQEIDGEPFIVILDGDSVYTLMPESKSGFKMSSNMNGDFEESFNLENLISGLDLDSIQKISVETYNGSDCYVIVQDVMGTTMKSWLDKKTGFPLRAESSGIEEGTNFIMEVTDFKTSGVSSKLFEVPSDYEIMDFNEMMDFNF
ncbi:UNVERIFIED_CONTAM: hypothetical protein Cloal_0745 [Acetivibrio alkalicellulosi]